MHTGVLARGDRVRLARHCPIESEGVAPTPGQAGVLVETPAPGDPRRCWGVRFEGLSLLWWMPETYLERLEGSSGAYPVRAVA